MSLVDISELETAEIAHILDRAEELERGAQPQKSGTVGTLFFEPSTRTRISFEMAAKRLGCNVATFDLPTSSTLKGESLRDTVKTMGSLGADLLVIRHSSVGACQKVAEWSGLSVVSAGEGRRSHPTQTLLDLLTIRRSFGSFSSLRVAIVGDVQNSRVARGLIDALPRLGADVTLVGPPTLVPRDVWKVGVTDDIDGLLSDLDVLYLLRVQKERGASSGFPSDSEYHRRFGIDKDRSSRLGESARIMHPGPMNRGVEISGDVADGPRSLILDQVRNGVPVRMAVLERELGRI